MTRTETYAFADLVLSLNRLAPRGGGHGIINCVAGLMRLAKNATRAAERACNYGESERAHERRMKRYQKRFEALVFPVFPSLRGKLVAEFTGDPRGSCFKLRHPDLQGNTWGGKEAGYAVGVY